MPQTLSFWGIAKALPPATQSGKLLLGDSLPPKSLALSPLHKVQSDTVSTRVIVSTRAAERHAKRPAGVWGTGRAQERIASR